ncbi:hypothetical protein SPHV1_1030004 [Novosphingobium sp. KN65.2]|nr:hypothetical protein SPHV1_1030004 [Novosphingobium sp. KN65.2]
MMGTCQTCRWWKRNKASDLVAEFEADPRPCVSGPLDLLRWVWNPVHFKTPPSEFEMDFLHRPNPTGGYCRRMPKAIRKQEDDFCGEHLPKDQTP